ncbi:MAG: MlaC/ttg2D family ABC transporter substrate-binding protein [Alphaproteobacteria bacterium]
MRALFNRCLLVAALALTPVAATAGPAADLIQGMGDQAVSTLAATEGNLAVRESRLRALLNNGFDMERIAKLALGRYWKRANPEQRQDYVAAFSEFVLATYTRRFGGYAGETFEVVSERPAGNEDVLVKSRIIRGAAAPIEAEWRVHVQGADAHVVDVAIEDISMAVTQRAEFASVVRQRGIDGLIHLLQARAGRLGARS